jgi:RHS repeat-associated protein
MNRVVQETDAVGVVTTYAYDGNGNQVQMVVDPGGMNVVTNRAYDANDRPISVVTNDGLNLASETLHYDINGMLALQVDARGGRTVLKYDEADQLVNRIDPESFVFTYTYSLDGNLATEQDPSESIKRYTYDNFNRLIEEIVDDGGLSLTTTYEYDIANNLISQVTPDGTKTCYVYDELNRRVAEIMDCEGLRLETTYAYDLNGNLLITTNHRGARSSREYDALNRLVREVLDEGGLSLAAERTYNAAGNLVSAIDHRGTESQFTYDALNRVVQVCQDSSGLNQCATYAYDSLGNLSTITDGEGTVVRNRYNGFSQLLEKIEDANGLARTTLYSYDNGLNLTSITDDNGNSTHYQYDLKSQAVETRFADGTAMTFAIEGRGLRVSSTDQEGVTLINEFDGAGRQITRTVSGTGSQSFTYDSVGRIVAAEGSLSPSFSKITIGYDRVSNVVGITETLDSNSWQTAYDYDYSSGIYTITYPSGAARVYTLDRLNRPESIQNGSGGALANFDYLDSQGQLGLTYATGVTETISLDALYRPVRISSSLADYRFGYDGAGNRTYRQRADLPGQPAEVYQYNSLYQVTNAWYGADSTSPGGINSADREVVYELDALANRLSVEEDGAQVTYGPTNGLVLSNPMNRYETVGALDYAYDLKGDLVDDGVFTYSYDGLNRQIGIESADTTARYIFNALNWRVAKVVTTTTGIATTYFIHDVSGQVLEERNGDNNLLARYTYDHGIDHPLVMERDGSTYYYNRDPQGSITEISDESGQLVEQITYDIYGQAFIADGLGNGQSGSAIGNPYLYTARRLDGETGNYYFRGRTYDPATGRFMQMDPLGYVDGMNLYASYFVVNGLDPSGLKAQSGSNSPAEAVSYPLFSRSQKSGAWYFSLSVSGVTTLEDCCKDGITIVAGKGKLSLRIKVEAGLGAGLNGWVEGQNVAGGSIKGPRVSDTIDLSISNRECGGPFDSVEICDTQALFIGGSIDASVGNPTSIRQFDSASGNFSASDPVLNRLNIGAALTVGLQGSIKSCATYNNGAIRLKSDFCGESVITLSATFLDFGQTVWRPFREEFRKFCVNLFNETMPMPNIQKPA